MSVNPERSGVVVSRVSLLEVGGGVGGGWRSHPRPGLVHGEDVEEGSGAEVVHVDHAVVPNGEVLVLTEHVAALVLALHDIFILQSGYRSTRLVVYGLLLVVGVVVILGDPPASVDAVDQWAEPQPDVGGRHVRPFVGQEH